MLRWSVSVLWRPDGYGALKFVKLYVSVCLLRCVKPNEEKKPLLWIQSKVLIQLHALSIIEALQLRQLGYSYRRQFQVCSEFLLLPLADVLLSGKALNGATIR